MHDFRATIMAKPGIFWNLCSTYMTEHRFYPPFWFLPVDCNNSCTYTISIFLGQRDENEPYQDTWTELSAHSLKHLFIMLMFYILPKTSLPNKILLLYSRFGHLGSAVSRHLHSIMILSGIHWVGNPGSGMNRADVQGRQPCQFSHELWGIAGVHRLTGEHRYWQEVS